MFSTRVSDVISKLFRHASPNNKDCEERCTSEGAYYPYVETVTVWRYISSRLKKTTLNIYWIDDRP